MPITFDENGLVVQTNGDGGDCAARTGQLYTGIHLNPVNGSGILGFNLAMAHLEPNKDGILLRYNQPPYNNPSDTSRDQTVPLLVALGFYKRLEILKRVFKVQFKHFMLFQNKDICSPEHLGVFIRSFYLAGLKSMILFYPLLLIGDIFNLINSLVRVYYSFKDKDDVGDDINHIQICLQNINSLPTPISWLSRKIYSKFRKYGVQWALDWYHRPSTFGNPINELYRPLIDKWFK